MLIHDSKYGKAYRGDCLEIMKSLPDNSVETVITDPPAGIGFMGREWDKNKGGKANWIEWARVRFQEAYRLTKPGGLAVVWGLPKTVHWTANALDDAGWEIKTKVYFLFGGGFPKGSDIGKRLDAAAGEVRENVDNPLREKQTASINNFTYGRKQQADFIQPEPVTEMAKTWDGWNTEIKPQCEEWIVAMKPLDTVHWNELHELTGQQYWHEVIELRSPKQRRKFEEIRAVPAASRVILIKHKPLVPGLKFQDSIIVDGRPAIITNQRDFKPWKVKGYAANALKWGVAGFNIDECRIEGELVPEIHHNTHGFFLNEKIGSGYFSGGNKRYPGMVTIDGHIAEEMDGEIGYLRGFQNKNESTRETSMFGTTGKSTLYGGNLSSGGPSRYFNRIYYYYGSKAGNDKHEGLDHLESRITTDRKEPKDYPSNRGKTPRKNHHPTVKSLEFMQWLCRLTKPPSPGTVLDIFGGTFTTGLAAYRENRKFIIIEQDPEYCKIGLARLKAAMEQRKFDF